ncbi:MAG TPA: heme exporter protein CcmD [Rhodocyclaceae bacterium]|nr:MAG: heme exporter protein CcmD [Betaproteobacteria bacterium CG2_30_68_42]PIV73238.1 MAG: heme exporter protein CcmD [Rhodocyclales bacterium CG17_big_fil_post_rev_8_21_14_2_50_68_7]PJA58302.1 MAG: heme exporter protein CcmD [Rhodocyclales bacterium CG_4_9_14_3_um_filter_68_10]HCX33070.1 heme exporter protein CcmD [Rhodocyclaceae bacterium]
MNWNSWSDFWSMGGYALYVWGSYAVTALVFALEAGALAKRRKDTLERLLRLRQSGIDGTERRDETET